MTVPATIKNSVLYIDGGIATFAGGNNGGTAVGDITLGISE